MTTLSVPIVADASAVSSTVVTHGQAIARHLDGSNANTRRAYARGMATFAEFRGATSPAAAGVDLIARTHGEANAIADDYKKWLKTQGIAANTINARLAALRSAVTLARKFGVIAWDLEVDNVDAKSYRDTRGPGIEVVKQMFKATASRNPRLAARDLAILSLMAHSALRRQSIVDLDLADLNLADRRLLVRLKGQHDQVHFNIHAKTAARLESWLQVRGLEAGPLFTRRDRKGGGVARLTGEAVRLIVERCGAAVGADVNPHGLRHTAATTVARATGNVFAVQKLLRHASPATSQHYLDNLDDLAIKATDTIVSALGD